MMGEKEFTAACMQLMFLAGSLDSGEFERLFKAILDDRAELLAHVAELESWAQRAVLYVTDDRLSETGRELLEGADGRDG